MVYRSLDLQVFGVSLLHGVTAPVRCRLSDWSRTCKPRYFRVMGWASVIRTVITHRHGAVILLAALGIAVVSSAAQERVLPKELLQYIQDAKKRGVNDAKIKRDAVAVGWAAPLVDEAITYSKANKANKASQPAPASGVAASPAVRPMTPATGSFEVPLSGQPSVTPRASLSEAAVPKDVPAANLGVPDDNQIGNLIGAGDSLQISVWKEPDVSVPSVVVQPDGTITVPLIREVHVAGMTPRQVEKVIADRLGKFVIDPNVTVVVAASTSKKIYVIGAVKMEGPLQYTYRMTVMQALSEAGGLTEYARRKKIYIIRNESGTDYRLDFNYDEVVKGERMEQNIQLLPGDTLVIPQ